MQNKLKLVTSVGIKKPSGEVIVSGAKNSATRLIAAALLSDKTSSIHNFPTKILDAINKLNFLQRFGVDVKIDDANNRVEINAKSLNITADKDLNLAVRTTYLLAAGQLKRRNSAIIPYPGGCKIGDRKIDLHFMVWEKMGAKIIEHNDYILLTTKGSLKGAVIDFPFPTIGGTENAVLCASIADGKSQIKNAYISPEVMDLINFLRNMGAKIETKGNSFIEIEGQKELNGASFSVMPDRIEALTWIVYAILSGGNMRITNVPFSEMTVPLIHIQNAGIDYYRNSNSILINKDCYPQGILPFQVACGTHPGVISDMQPFFTLLALKAQGNSLIVDYRYPERTQFLNELQKCLPANTINFNTDGYIYINGNQEFGNGEMESTDLRGSMAAILFALCSDKKVVVNGIDKALRGYNDFFNKLNKLGISYELL